MDQKNMGLKIRELQAENAELSEEKAFLIASSDAADDLLRQLEAENAKLREEIAFLLAGSDAHAEIVRQLKAEVDGQKRRGDLFRERVEKGIVSAERAIRTITVLRDALEDMVYQHCYDDERKEFDSMALSANAYAMKVLADGGRLKIKHTAGRRVIAVKEGTDG